MVEMVITPATLADAEELAPVMREADRREVFLYSGKGPLEALREGIENSREAFTIRFDGKIAAIFGVVELKNAGCASPWMLGSDELKRSPWKWLRVARSVINMWHSRYALLINSVHEDHVESVRMLRWLGFRFGTPAPVPPRGGWFLPFWM